MSFKLQNIKKRKLSKSSVGSSSKRKIKSLFISRVIIFVVLTAITQIGGLVFLLSLVLTRHLQKRRFLYRILIFVGLYGVSTYWIVPSVATYFGREKIQSTAFVQPHSPFYSWSNRNYVTPELNQVLQNIGQKLSERNPGIKLVYLDANFPFINGFRLLPHRYHNDGKKIDISFVYKEQTSLTNKKPSFSGYGVYENPLIEEWNQINACLETGYFQYDFTKFVTFGYTNPGLQFSEHDNRSFLMDILQEEVVHTIFIEPHLKTRLGLDNEKFVYHGCGTVRHDDHIHIEVN